MIPTNVMLAQALRQFIAVIEAGAVNQEQRRLILQVRAALGDSRGLTCLHENTIYEEGDGLVCQDCREVLEPSSR